MTESSVRDRILKDFKYLVSYYNNKAIVFPEGDKIIAVQGIGQLFYVNTAFIDSASLLEIAKRLFDITYV